MNISYLRQRIRNSDLKYSTIANYLGITVHTLKSKLSGRRRFRPDEILDLFEILDFSRPEKVMVLFTDDCN